MADVKIKEFVMEKNHTARAAKYYTLVGEKNIRRGFKKYPPSACGIFRPSGNLKGKEAVIEATYHFMNSFKSLTIRAKFGEGDQAIVVYDVDIPWMQKISRSFHAKFSRWSHCQDSAILR